MEPGSEDRKENHDLGRYEEKESERQQTLYFESVVSYYDAFNGHVTESNSHYCNCSNEGQ